MIDLRTMTLSDKDIAYLIYNPIGTIEVVSPLGFIPEAEVKLDYFIDINNLLCCRLIVDSTIWRYFIATKIESININTLHKELIIKTIFDDTINYSIEYYGSLKMIRRLLRKCLD